MDPNVDQILKERFAQVPKVVQDAILSSHVEQHLRDLAQKHKLHYDQWMTLENEVMMTLLGIQPLDKLGENISREASVPKEVGEAIAIDASQIIFEPIRLELERELGNPNATPEVVSDEEKLREAAIVEAHEEDAESGGIPTATFTATPAAPMPPHSVNSEPSSVRNTIVGDPYREPAV